MLPRIPFGSIKLNFPLKDKKTQISKNMLVKNVVAMETTSHMNNDIIVYRLS